jgi:hypothetical protein
MTRLWKDQEGLRTLVAGLLKTVKSENQNIDEAVRFGIQQAEKEAHLRLRWPGVDAGFAAALEERANHKGTLPHVLPDADPMSRFVNSIAASGKAGHK